MCHRRIVDEFVSATRGKSNSMVFTYSRFFCHNRGCLSNCLNLFVRQPLPSIYFCVCMTVYVCVQSFYVSMCVFVFVVRAGELSSQMLIVHKYVDSNKSIQISPLRRWQWTEFMKRHMIWWLFWSPLRTPSQISLEQPSQPCLPKSTHPVGSSIGASSYINTLLGSPPLPPPLYLVLRAYLPSRPYRFDILSAIDNYQIPGRILLKSVFDLLTLLTDFVHHHHR